MKILLNQPISNNDNNVVSPHLGCYRIKHYMESKGFIIDICEPSDSDELKESINKVEQGCYDIVGFSISSQQEKHLALIEQYRTAADNADKKVLFIAGNSSASCNYSFWLNNKIDAVMLGYAEDVLLELCERINKGESFRNVCLSQKGVACKDYTGMVVMNMHERLTPEIFKYYSYDNVKTNFYPWKKFWERRKKSGWVEYPAPYLKAPTKTLYLHTTSHCTGGCGFCDDHSRITKSYQHHKVCRLSAEDLYDLVLYHYNEYSPDEIYFADVNFFAMDTEGIKRGVDFSKKIAAAKNRGELPVNISFTTMARIDEFILVDRNNKIINNEMIELLSQAGFRKFSIGVETFIDRLRAMTSMHKSRFNSDDTKKVLNGLLKHHIYPTINYIIGIPEMTLQELIDSAHIILDYADKGASISANLWLIPTKNTLAFKSGKYTIEETVITDPNTGIVTDIKQRYKLFDEKLDQLLLKMEQKQNDACEKYRKSWINKIMPITICSVLSLFTCMAEELGDKILGERCEYVYNKMLADVKEAHECF